jgi:hypothetical protein
MTSIYIGKLHCVTINKQTLLTTVRAAASLDITQTLAFSDDEALLCTAGIPEDGRLLVWDMSTGAIVAIVQQHACPAPVQCMAWGGMVRDVKRRDTRCYQLATAGDKKVSFCYNAS